MDHSEEIVQFFEKNFNEKKCHDLCRQTRFIQRSTSKLKGYEFIKTMVIPDQGLSTDSLNGLCRRMREYNSNANLSSQALCERISNISSSRLMKQVFSEIMLKVYELIKAECLDLVEGLEKYNRVLLQDSTVAVLNKRLENEYKGVSRGNNCVKSQVKIDLIYDLGKGLIVDGSLFKGRDPDQGLANRILNFIQPGDLVIRDLGYFSIISLEAIAKANAYFLSRLKAGIHFYLNIDDQIPLDIAKHLKKKKLSNQNVIELRGYLGKEKVPIRMIIYRQSEEITKERIRNANKHSRKKGETISKNKRLLLHFAIFITNCPSDILEAKIVGTIYRLRWEIELVFKRWKYLLEIDYLKGISKERIDCLIWSRMCTVLIIELITGIFKNLAKKVSKTELSSVKVVQYLMRSHEFCRAMVNNRLEEFFEQMEKDILRMLLKDKRRRKTMLERVRDKESYYKIQEIEDEYVA